MKIRLNNCDGINVSGNIAESIEIYDASFKDKCEYCEIEYENKHNNGYNFEDAKFCRMCGRKL